MFAWISLTSFWITALPVQADAGVPMLAVMAIPMWGLLLLIVPLEAYLAKRILSISHRRSYKLSIAANAASTVLGVPITWLILVVVEMAASHEAKTFNEILFKANGIQQLLMTLPWLYPFEGSLYWMIPSAAIILLIPFYFVSVWSEYVAAKLLFRDIDRKLLKKWAWISNSASYALMIIIAACWLGVWVSEYKSAS